MRNEKDIEQITTTQSVLWLIVLGVIEVGLVYAMIFSKLRTMYMMPVTMIAIVIGATLLGLVMFIIGRVKAIKKWHKGG